MVTSAVLFVVLAPKPVTKSFAKKPITLPVKTVQIVDLTSNTRPIAVMINNHNYARVNHAGLQDAFVVYELIVEGGITRLMAIFKDQDTARIGSVRSSRHNFLDYAMEYDAIYVHYGWSNLAKNDIASFKINNINGLYDSSTFWRDTTLNVPTEHTAFTSMEKIKQTIEKKNYQTTTDTKIPLNYSVYNVDISKEEDSIVANNISIPYSNYMTTSYTYDSENKVYKRYANGKEHTDAVTKEQYTAKNIIIMKVKNYSVDSYGRQNLDTTGTGEGYFITNGYARKITWEKPSRSSKTTYKYLDGTEIVLNDGNTFIQVEPIDKTPSITE
jgi:hypothetical protein